MFCQECSNFCSLYDDISTKSLYWDCKPCGFRELIKDPCVFKKTYTRQETTDIPIIQHRDPTLPVHDKKCNTCHRPMRFIRNANLSLTFICEYC